MPRKAQDKLLADDNWLPTRKEDVSISFGQDISEIPNEKDLSLIEEGTDEEPTPQKENLSSSYLSRSALDRMESGPPARPIPPSLLDQSEDSSLDMTGSTSDVIQELNDLSYQISKLRAR